MNKIAIFALASSAALVLPKAAFADDRQLEKRLEALEAKMERMAAIEAENKELKARLQKTEAKLEKVTAQKVATVAPAKAVERSVAPVAATTPTITKETPVTPVSIENNWSGVYAGINAGYGTGSYQITSSVLMPSWSYQLSPTSYLTSGAQYTKTSSTGFLDGPVAGGQFGYNHQFASNILLGIEADINWADIIDRNNYNSNTMYNVASGHLYNQYYSRQGIDWIGSARLRIGYAIGAFLPYLTGGFSYGGVSISSKNLMVCTSSYCSPSGGVFGYRDFRDIPTGFAVGAGAEYRVANNWSVKGEYIYSQLNGIEFSYSGTGYDIANTLATLRVPHIGIHQARVGLNYHTDWLKELPVSLR